MEVFFDGFCPDEILDWVAYYKAIIASLIVHEIPIPQGGVYDEDDQNFEVCLEFNFIRSDLSPSRRRRVFVVLNSLQVLQQRTSS